MTTKPRKEQLATTGASSGDTIEVDGSAFVFAANDPGASSLADTLIVGNTTDGYDISLSDGDTIIAPDGYIDLNVLSTGLNNPLIRFQEDSIDFLTFNPEGSIELTFAGDKGDVNFNIDILPSGTASDLNLIGQSILTGTAGSVTLSAGDVVGSGGGGSIGISGGASAVGGDISITAGAGNGSTGGNLDLRSGTGTTPGRVDISVGSLNVLESSGSGSIDIGDSAGNGGTIDLNVGTGFTMQCQIGVSIAYTWSATTFSLAEANIEFSSSNSSPILRQASTSSADGEILQINAQDTSFASATGGDLFLRSGNASGSTSIGGSLQLRAGTGTDVDGYLDLQDTNGIAALSVYPSGDVVINNDIIINSNTTSTGSITAASGIFGFNVLAYGATGDGVTDDTTGIQAAIDAAAASGGLVLFPSGTYIISSALTITSDSNVILRGEPNAVISTTSTTADTIAFTSATQCGIENIIIRGINIPTAGSGIDFDTCTDCFVTNTIVERTFRGMILDSSPNTVIRDLYLVDLFADRALWAFGIESSRSTGVIDGLYCKVTYPYELTNTFETWQTATEYVQGDIVKNGGNIYQCDIAGTSAGSGGPTGIPGTTAINARTTTITDNTVEWLWVSDALIWIETDGYTENFTINNFIAQNGDRGVNSQDGPAPAKNIEFSNCIISQAYDHGLRFTTGIDIKCSNVTVEDTLTSNGVEWGASDGQNFSWNGGTIKNSGGTNMFFGLALNGATVTNLHSIGALVDGMRFDGSFNVVVTNCFVANNGQNGIQVDGDCTECIVKNITYSNNTTDNLNPPELTINAGVIAVPAYIDEIYAIDTQDNDPTDTVTTINGAQNGWRLAFKTVVSTRDVTFEDGTGNLELAGDFVTTDPIDTISMLYREDISSWVELSRSDNG